MHYYEQPKFQVLAACDPVVDATSVRELVDGLRRSMIACSKRVDRSFSSVWLDRLSSLEFERAVRCLNLQVAATLVCIVRAEKKLARKCEKPGHEVPL